MGSTKHLTIGRENVALLGYPALWSKKYSCGPDNNTTEFEVKNNCKNLKEAKIVLH